MRETPAPRDPGRDENPDGDRPWLGSAGWELVTQSPEWGEDFLAVAAHDEDPGDLEYEDPDNVPPPDLDDRELAALFAEAWRLAEDQARAEAELAGPGS